MWGWIELEWASWALKVTFLHCLDSHFMCNNFPKLTQIYRYCHHQLIYTFVEKSKQLGFVSARDANSLTILVGKCESNAMYAILILFSSTSSMRSVHTTGWLKYNYWNIALSIPHTIFRLSIRTKPNIWTFLRFMLQNKRWMWTSWVFKYINNQQLKKIYF